MNDKHPLDAYQQALAPKGPQPGQLPPGVSQQRFYALGIMGETGEVVDCVKKAIRDHFGQLGPVYGTLVDELGDVLWYFTQELSLTGTPLSALINQPVFAELVSIYEAIDAENQVIALYISAVPYAGGTTNDARLEFLAVLAAIAKRVNTNLKYVAERNEAKLAARHPERKAPKLKIVGGLDAGLPVPGAF